MQRTLFRLPAPARYDPTLPQKEMLDLIAYNEGNPLNGHLRMGAATVLRRLIREEMIECVALGPARYKLTPRGRLVRTRGLR